MKYLLTLLVIPMVITQECCTDKSKSSASADKNGKEEVKSALPACVQKTIDDAAKQSPAERPVQIDEYTYNGKTVYVYTAACCDQYNTAYDSDCKEICSPSGGITGKGDGKCADFNTVAKHVKQVWKSPDNK